MLIAQSLRTLKSCRTFATLREKVPKIEAKYLYEPKFEDPHVYPVYDVINIRLQGYDYVPLEKYQSFIHKIAKRFQFHIVESFAVSARNLRAVAYKQNSKVVDSDVSLTIYDRQLKLTEVSAVRLPLFISFLQAHLPVGVTLTFKRHGKADEDYRYIPDKLLKQKQDELRSLDDPLVRKALGWE